MSLKKIKSTDPDMRGSYPAMKRAAKRALRRAIETGTPCYAMIDGKIVNRNPAGRLPRRNNKK